MSDYIIRFKNYSVNILLEKDTAPISRNFVFKNYSVNILQLLSTVYLLTLIHLKTTQLIFYLHHWDSANTIGG